MPISCKRNLVRFDAVCSVEDALPLLELCQSGKALKFDLKDCSYLHTSLLQILLTTGSTVTALPADPLLARHLSGVLSGAKGIV